MNKTRNSRWSLKKPLFVEESDIRYTRHLKQLQRNGFSDAETWALDSVIAEFILPRLIRFKEVNNGFPGDEDMTSEKWDAILDQMIFAFNWSLHCEDEKYDKLTKEDQAKMWQWYEEGMRLFAKWFRHLWW